MAGPLSDRAVEQDEPFGGRYRVERELGRGGMATVYLARDLKHHARLVALKQLRKEIAALLGRERFLLEIDIVAQLTHPHILSLYDSGESEGNLFFVGPYVEGGSLADRLLRTGPLPVPEALALTRQVADALTYAHGLGIVHRDIKPGNILLAGSHAYVSDFGIARAIRRAVTEERMTEVGLTLGTPSYMAPEQLRGASQVDGRADEYSLACVLYEMLMGEPPHGTSDSGGVGAALRARRPDVPAHVAVALDRALAGETGRRFPSVAEFAEALEAGTEAGAGGGGLASLFTLRRVVVGAGLVTLGVVVAVLVRGMVRHTDRIVPDTTRYAVLPVEGELPRPGMEREVELRLRSALTRWVDVKAADPVRVREAVGRLSRGRLSSAAAIGVSRAAGAGRYLRTSAQGYGDSLRLQSTMYQLTPGGDSLLVEHTVTLPATLAGADVPFAALADWLLFRGSPPPGGADSMGTRSLGAWEAFAAGITAMHDWRLDDAANALASATQLDPAFARASLWLAVVRAWSGEEPARWRYAVEQAHARRDRLGDHDAVIADALLAAAGGQFPEACRLWRGLTVKAPSDFAAWYGTGNCETSDDAVLRDPRSPSGWRFRTSYHTALKAYRRAFELLPSLLGAFRGDAYESAGRLLFTRGTQARRGRAVRPDTTTFQAWPAWQGDSLAMVPYPEAAWRRSGVPSPPTDREAIHQQRLVLRDLALTWATAFPQNADAREGLATALEMLGDPAALDTIRGARRLVRTDAERIRVMGSEAWMKARMSLPDRLNDLAAARALADSLLGRYATRPSAPEPSLLASLAMLTGRPTLAAALLRREAMIAGWDVAGGVASPGVALLAFAAAGAPADSLRATEAEVEAAITRSIPVAGRTDARLEWLGRAATLAFPDCRLASLESLVGLGDPVVDVLVAFARGDTAAALATFAMDARARQQQTDPASRTFDTIFPQAWLLAALGHGREAMDRLDPTLAVVGEIAPRGLELPVHAGSLVRAMALRAELARRTDDPATARRWARAVLALWQHGEDAVQPLVGRMAPLAR
jgi:tRNA A-37 threonylcarbamoyl transferase component Bud32/tetratricopeptide (TPR) repeat protein